MIPSMMIMTVSTKYGQITFYAMGRNKLKAEFSQLTFFNVSYRGQFYLEDRDDDERGFQPLRDLSGRDCSLYMSREGSNTDPSKAACERIRDCILGAIDELKPQERLHFWKCLAQEDLREAREKVKSIQVEIEEKQQEIEMLGRSLEDQKDLCQKLSVKSWDIEHPLVERKMASLRLRQEPSDSPEVPQ